MNINDAKTAGYWSNVAFNATWKYEEYEDNDKIYSNNYTFVDSISTVEENNVIRSGGTYASPSYEYLAYTESYSSLSKYSVTFFCPSKNMADAMAECIQNNYTKIGYDWFYWDSDNTSFSVTYWKTIQSVSSLGLCSDIGYTIPYISTANYNFANNSSYSSKYVVEILLDNRLSCANTQPSKKICFFLKFQ